jgi:hypothetical protein
LLRISGRLKDITVSSLKTLEQTRNEAKLQGRALSIPGFVHLLHVMLCIEEEDGGCNEIDDVKDNLLQFWHG